MKAIVYEKYGCHKFLNTTNSDFHQKAIFQIFSTRL
jgi:hypothetical protein